MGYEAAAQQFEASSNHNNRSSWEVALASAVAFAASASMMYAFPSTDPISQHGGGGGVDPGGGGFGGGSEGPYATMVVAASFGQEDTGGGGSAGEVAFEPKQQKSKEKASNSSLRAKVKDSNSPYDVSVRVVVYVAACVLLANFKKCISDQ